MTTLASFDTETTGVDPENDRIVSAVVVIVRDGLLIREWSWLVDPGIEIPAGATAVHGITTEQARNDGADPRVAIPEIAAVLQDVLGAMPLVVFNAPYDLTLLDREHRRHAPNPFEGDIGANDGIGLQFPLTPIIDPFVLDKAMDKWRKGSRKLRDMAKHYQGLSFVDEGWHGAKADALAAASIAEYQLRDQRLAGATPEQIHGWQIAWARKQADSFADYLRGQGKPADGVRGDWPIVPFLDDTEGES